jgi:ABC-2 type transport system ATP-binding protein
MTETQLYFKAAIIQRKLRDDILNAYEDLFDFYNNYSESSSIRDEIILFGSSIAEVVGKSGVITEPKRNELISIGNDIIESIISNFQKSNFINDNSEYKLREFWLNMMPKENTVVSSYNISKKNYSGFELNNISFQLRLGEITGVIGENGSGKTTLLKIIAGELKPDSGRISYPSLTSRKLHWADIKKQIGYVRQHINPWKGGNSVMEQLQFMAALKGIKGKDNNEACKFIVARLGLEKHMHKSWNELSGGFKLRFELARQLVWRPKLLILDEPLANLDIKVQLQFLTDLRNLCNSISHSMAVIITSQIIHEIEKISNMIIFMRDGNAIYNDQVGNVNESAQFRCFEIDFDGDPKHFLFALQDVGLLEIKESTFYKTIYVQKETTPKVFLEKLSTHDICIKYFRDITNSTRMLFEK